jgi:uncharacterized protein YdeI (YjbR/CyaY-like superfamily)
MNGMNSRVDAFLGKAKKWREEFEKLRMIVLDCGLTEELKWGKPCYTFEQSNIVIIQGFKEYCALLFFKGAVSSECKIPRSAKIEFPTLAGIDRPVQNGLVNRTAQEVAAHARRGGTFRD